MKTLLSAVVLLSAGLGIVVAPSPETQNPSQKEVLEERLEAAKLVWEQLNKVPVEGVADMDTRALWSRRIAEASIDAGALTAREALGEHLRRMQDRLIVAKSLEDDGRAGALDLALVRFHVAEAKHLLSQVSAK